MKHIDADFMASALFGDTVTVHTSVVEFKKASLIMRQEILNQEGKLLFRMQVTLACMKGTRVSKIPEPYKAFLTPDLQAPDL